MIGSVAGVVGLLISYHHGTAAGATMALCAVGRASSSALGGAATCRRPVLCRGMADARLEGTEIADSVIDLIGNTPLVRLKRISEIEQICRACWR